MGPRSLHVMDATSSVSSEAARPERYGAVAGRTTVSFLLALLVLAAPAAPAEAAAPRVDFATYWGGSAYDDPLVARAPDGAVYLAGSTTSSDVPVKRPPFGSHGGRWDVWITKLSPDAERVRWSTYLGGRGVESLGEVAVDSSGNVLLVGSTNTGSLPSENAAQDRLAGNKDAFVTKLSPHGDVVFSTFLGGSEGDHATSVATDAAGSVYVHGYTFSPDFPTTPGAFKEESTHDSQDATLVELTPSGDVVYSTRLGGEDGSELGSDVAVDASGNAYVSGWTDAADFPTIDAAQASIGGSYDAYVAKVDPAGATLGFSTYLGGNDLEGGGALVETDEGVAVGLVTYSRDLDATGFQTSRGGARTDGYLALYSPDGALEATSYLGGEGSENVTAIGTDGAGGLYVAGATGSKDFPLKDPFQPRFGGRSDDSYYLADAFVTKVTTDLAEITWSSFFGGSRDDGAGAVSVTGGEVWVAGSTYSRDLPTRRALDRTFNGDSDGWLARVLE